MTGSGQLTLRLPFETAHGVEDFFVSGSNAAAAEMIGRWPDWSAPSFFLTGPAGSGKTHLARIWQARSNAARTDAASLSDGDLTALAAHKALVVEDVDGGVGEERVLFHVLNAARENGQFVLLTSASAPGGLDVALPDLRSRLRALPVVALGVPDEALVKAVLVKLFSDRQLTVPANVVSYMALHVGPSMALAIRAVALLDEMSLTLRRRVSLPLAARALEALGETGDAP